MSHDSNDSNYIPSKSNPIKALHWTTLTIYTDTIMNLLKKMIDAFSNYISIKYEINKKESTLNEEHIKYNI